MTWCCRMTSQKYTVFILLAFIFTLSMKFYSTKNKFDVEKKNQTKKMVVTQLISMQQCCKLKGSHLRTIKVCLKVSKILTSSFSKFFINKSIEVQHGYLSKWEVNNTVPLCSKENDSPLHPPSQQLAVSTWFVSHSFCSIWVTFNTLYFLSLQ